jgi:hypothetical protein
LIVELNSWSSVRRKSEKEEAEAEEEEEEQELGLKVLVDTLQGCGPNPDTFRSLYHRIEWYPHIN